MTARSWIGRLFARPVSRPIKAPARRLAVEALEDRLVPALFHVTSLLDDGSPGTLRDAILQANANPGPDAIDFQVTGTISLNGSQLPAFTDDATTAITGPSGGITLDAHGASRIFEVNAGATASLTGLTLANGSALDGGAGIYNQGTMSLTNVTLSGNTAAFAGDFFNTVVGGNGGGIRNDGTLSLTNCTVSGNTAIDGGGIWNDGTLSLTNVTLSGNTAAYSIVVVDDGGIPSGEIVGGNGGGIGNDGTLSLTNCTLSGNSALDGGGIGNAGTLSLTNCTLSGNSAVGHPFFGGGFGGGIYNAADLTLNNSIVANSPSGGDISGGYSGGHNLFGEVALGPLADNGGPTQTMALADGSPAIGAADPALAPATDQRGAPRAAAPDIGAFEVVHDIVVTTLADEDNGTIDPSLGSGTSLREAIAFADQNPGGAAITFAVSGTLALDGTALPAITGDLMITGPAGGLTIDAHGASGILQVNAGAAVSLSDLTLANGSDSVGGGIDNSGTMSLTDVALSGNGALDGGGGIDNGGTMSLTNVTLAGNTAAFAGGFTDPVDGGHGGGIRNDGTLSLTNCTLSGNSALDGCGVWNDGTLSLTNVTLSGNTAAYSIVVVDDGGIPSGEIVGGNGGGIGNDGTLSLTNCTLSGNSALDGGGIGNAGTLSLTNCTLSGNSAVGHPFFGGGSGGGIYNAAALTLNNSIVANSPSGGDISGGYSGGHNLFGEVALGPLADNGGPTQTMALADGSPAIDAGDSTAPGLPGADQRGFARLSGAAVDVGAFEVQEPLFNTTALPDGTYGTPYSNTITATATGGAAGPFTFAVTAGTLPPGLSLTTGGALSGTPTAAGSFSFTITATDSDSDTGSQGYTLTIDKAALTITTANEGKTYGTAFTPDGTSQFTTSGLVNGDTVSGVTLTSAGYAAAAGTTTVYGLARDPDGHGPGFPNATPGSGTPTGGLDNFDAITYVDLGSAPTVGKPASRATLTVTSADSQTIRATYSGDGSVTRAWMP